MRTAIGRAVGFAGVFIYMISGNTGGHFARAGLTNACRGMVCRVTVRALRAAMVILIDTGIIIQAFIAGAGACYTNSILTQFVIGALCATITAVR